MYYIYGVSVPSLIYIYIYLDGMVEPFACISICMLSATNVPITRWNTLFLAYYFKCVYYRVDTSCTHVYFCIWEEGNMLVYMHARFSLLYYTAPYVRTCTSVMHIHVRMHMQVLFLRLNPTSRCCPTPLLPRPSPHPPPRSTRSRHSLPRLPLR